MSEPRYVKTRPDAPAGFYEAEAAGLAWLAQAGGARMVGVLAVSPGRIELERLEPHRASEAAARAFGSALATTHAAGATAFGAPPEGWTGPMFIGKRPLPRGSSERWGEHYARDRVLPYAEIALGAGGIDERGLRLVREACELVASGRFDDERPPARIHGDLWNGNVFWTRGGVVLIDPAAQGGHPETDLAMLELFGCPHLGAVLEAYADAAPLLPGWRHRVPLHQLHPLAVHAASYGPTYGAALADAARATLELADRLK